jgi:chemotaxis protein MotB
LFDLEDSSLFEEGTSQPSEKMNKLLRMLADTFGIVSNSIAVAGHTNSVPVVVKDNQTWELSLERAQRTRALLVQFGVDDLRFERVTGMADRSLVAENPAAARNRRIEITLLRGDAIN